MKKLILILLILFWSGFAYGATYTCGTNGVPNSCTVAAMNALVGSSGSASDGDTINIATGSHAWSGAIVIVRRVTITGSGYCGTTDGDDGASDCGGAKNPAWTGSTTINGTGTILVLRGANNADSNIIRISGLRITGECNWNYDWWSESPGGFFVVSENNYAKWRVDNNYTTCTDSGYEALHITAFHSQGVYGVVDHNLMTNSGPDGGFFEVYSGLYDDGETIGGNGGHSGMQAMARDIDFGSEDFIFFEDNTMKFGCTGGSPFGPGLTDAFAAGRFVYRYNYGVNGFVIWHDHSGGGSGCAGCNDPKDNDTRGTQAVEVYANTIEWDSTGACQDGYGNAAVYHRSGTALTYDNTYTKTPGSSGFAGFYRFAIGRLSGIPSQEQDWGPCDGTRAWDGNGSPAGYPCMDQPGWSSDINGTGEYDDIQPQELVPTRIWNNTIPGDEAAINNGYPTYIVQNREYYYCVDDSCGWVDTFRASYTPYTYPHPLITGTAEPVGIQGTFIFTGGTISK